MSDDLTIKVRLTIWADALGRAGALVATLWALAATSAPYARPPMTCGGRAQELIFDVTGNCGPPGAITVHSSEGTCGLSVTNAASVGLPAGGRFDDEVDGQEIKVDLRTTPWSLSEVVPRRADRPRSSVPGMPTPPPATTAGETVRLCRSILIRDDRRELRCTNEDRGKAPPPCTAELVLRDLGPR